MRQFVIVIYSLLLIMISTAPVYPFSSGKDDTPEEKLAKDQRKAQDEYNDGVKHMDKAREIGLKSDSTYAYNYRATTEAKAGKEYEKAIKNFEKAIDHYAKYAEAWNNLGYCYRKLGKFDESLVAYNKAILLKDDFAQAREYRGETYLAMNDLDKANTELAFLQKLESPYADTLSKAIEIYQLTEVQKKLDESKTTDK